MKKLHTYLITAERNKEIIKRMYNVIEKNYNIVIWQDDIQLKDVNEMIMNGLSLAKLKIL